MLQPLLDGLNAVRTSSVASCGARRDVRGASRRAIRRPSPCYKLQKLPNAVDQDLGAAARMLSRPAAISRSITCATGRRDRRDAWINSGGDSA